MEDDFDDNEEEAHENHGGDECEDGVVGDVLLEFVDFVVIPEVIAAVNGNEEAQELKKDVYSVQAFVVELVYFDSGIQAQCRVDAVEREVGKHKSPGFWRYLLNLKELLIVLLQLEYKDHEQEQHECEVLAALRLNILYPFIVQLAHAIDFISLLLKLHHVNPIVRQVQIRHIFQELLLVGNDWWLLLLLLGYRICGLRSQS